MPHRRSLITLDCSNCGHSLCCRKLKVRLTAEEYGTGYYLLDPDSRGQFLAAKENGECIYLSASGKCAIYDTRPGACRRYSCLKDRRILELY